MNIVKAEKQSELHGIAIELLSSYYDIKNRGEQCWTKRFKDSELSHIGYLLKIDNKYVGFIGVIVSKITIHEKINLVGIKSLIKQIIII